MTFNQQIQDDFERAVLKAFWRNVLSRLAGEDNQLLPYYEIRDKMPIRGQHYIGLRQVPIDQIVGSMGRYHDFDRAFLPVQRRTKDRWISIDRAHYLQVPLPPVELYKIGEIYFVKDGNHRISVARQRGQEFVDAYVTEVDIPVKLTSDMSLKDLDRKQELAIFLSKTEIDRLRPGLEIELRISGRYSDFLQHIDNHRWYLGEKRKSDIPYKEAVADWLDHVYLPLTQVLQEQNLLKEFPGASEADLCLWIMNYQGYLRQAYQGEELEGEDPRAIAAHQLIGDYPLPAVKKLINVMSRTSWLDEMIVDQEMVNFLDKTRLLDLRPEANIRPTLPGKYARILEHIAVHRWYMGEKRRAEVAYSEAVVSWYDTVYSPLIEVIRDQEVLKEFPGRTETDLYLWIIKHQWHLREAYGEDVPMQAAAEQFTEDYFQRNPKKKSRK
jgi:hypothetical protein